MDFSISEEEQKENARMFLVINTLKRLEIYVSDESTFDLMTEEKKMDLLIQYYVIDEFSKSPYNFLLYKLNREKFNLRYKKTIQYIDKKDLERFVSYLIICLRDEITD